MEEGGGDHLSGDNNEMTRQNLRYPQASHQYESSIMNDSIDMDSSTWYLPISCKENLHMQQDDEQEIDGKSQLVHQSQLFARYHSY